jgi:hypothetical protein
MAQRIVQCPVCDKELEVRSGFASETLTNHVRKDHKERLVK